MPEGEASSLDLMRDELIPLNVQGASRNTVDADVFGFGGCQAAVSGLPA